MDAQCLLNQLVAEGYPATFSMDEFSRINSYAGKLRYADAHLTKLASGSGRTVYQIDNEKVLKIAKNGKGVAQNQIEAEPFLQKYDLTARVFESDSRGLYLEMELAKKVGRKRFEQLTGVTIEDLADYLRYENQRHQVRACAFCVNHSPEFIAKMSNNEFVGSLSSLNADYDFKTGDEGRLSTWGEVLRD